MGGNVIMKWFFRGGHVTHTCMVERYWSSVQTPSFCNLTNLLILDSQYFLLEIVSAQCKKTENRTLCCGGAPAGQRRGWPNRFPSKDAPHLDTITEEEGSDWDRPSSQNIRLWKMPHFNLLRATVPGPTSDSSEPTSFPGYWRYLKSSVCFPGTKSIGIDPLCFHLIARLKTSQVTYVTMVPRVGNETLRPLGVATGNALSVTRSEDTYEKTPPVGRRQPMTSLPAYHNISAAGRIHHQLLRLKLASEAWLKAQGTQCLVPHSGNHGYIRNLRRSPSWELELRPLGVATGNVIPTSPCWGECKPISQKRRALSQLYPA